MSGELSGDGHRAEAVRDAMAADALNHALYPAAIS
jgi:hypothetical protein